MSVIIVTNWLKIVSPAMMAGFGVMFVLRVLELKKNDY